MAGVTAADVWRIYVKPSLNGLLVFRKKTVIRRSSRVIERNRRFASIKPSVGCGGQGPIGKDGKAHTPIKQFIACEREKLGGGRAMVPRVG